MDNVFDGFHNCETTQLRFRSGINFFVQPNTLSVSEHSVNSPYKLYSLRVHGYVEVFRTNEIHQEFEKSGYSLGPNMDIDIVSYYAWYEYDELESFNLQLLWICQLHATSNAFSMDLKHLQDLVDRYQSHTAVVGLTACDARFDR